MPSPKLLPSRMQKLVNLSRLQLLLEFKTLTTPIEAKYRFHFCYRRGEACSKNKRALEELGTVVKDIQSKY